MDGWMDGWGRIGDAGSQVEDLKTADRFVNLRTADVRVSEEVRRFEESDGLVVFS
jgi:hypothetical protein